MAPVSSSSRPFASYTLRDDRTFREDVEEETRPSSTAHRPDEDEGFFVASSDYQDPIGPDF
ncbi:hypothetical protein ACTMS0_27155 [Micromonospora sp. H33]|uniref:hypothetical protein n=1 Tax=Micromonospora sp. H33 TaxID=3452215 RepID=UPI003F8BC60B